MKSFPHNTQEMKLTFAFSLIASLAALGTPLAEGKEHGEVGRDRSLQTVNVGLYSVSDAKPTRFFYVPFREEDVFYDMLRKINSDKWNGKWNVRGDMVSLISFAISTDQTVIWYDHWEDGYEGSVTDLDGTTSTEVWGDGDASNGCRPDVVQCTDADDYLNAGDTFILEGKIPVPRNKDNWEEAGGILYDGGDSVSSTYPITITRGTYAEEPGSLLAGAVEVFDMSSMWGTSFEAPVGQDFHLATEAFEYTRLFFMSGSDDNVITLPNGSTATLNQGESMSLSVNQGDKITSTSKIQVNLCTGDPGSNYELRLFSLFPVEKWSDNYHAAVGDSYARTKLVLYSGSDITVTFTILNDNGEPYDQVIDLEAKKSKYSPVIPTGSGAIVKSSANDNFIALSITDSEMYTDSPRGGTEYLTGRAFDWGYPVIPTKYLTSQVIVGWGYGCTENDCEGKTERSAVWVSPTADATIYIDYDNSGNPNDYEVQDVDHLQSFMIRDTTDHDMSGALIFATKKGSGVDGPAVSFASAWGQDPAVSRYDQHLSLDLGTTVIPFDKIAGTKTGPAKASPGETLEFVISIENFGQTEYEAGDFTVFDDLPEGMTYVEGSSKYSDCAGKEFVTVADDTDGDSKFPLDEDGLSSSGILARRGGVHIVKYKVKVAESISVSQLRNEARLELSNFPDVPMSFTTEIVATEAPTSAPTDAPTSAPTSDGGILGDERSGGGGGDPHFKTWSGRKYDYHGECDMVLINNPTFRNGLGLRLDIRTTRSGYFSYIERAALSIGGDVFEFANDVDAWLLNGKKPEEGATIGGFEIRKYGKLAISIRLDNKAKAKIDFYSRKNGMMYVHVDGGETNIFDGSLGLMGHYGTGALVGRDGETINSEVESHAKEWQVRDTETMLFQEARAPQYPEVCVPPAKLLGSRLGDTHMKKAAEIACADWKEEDKPDCIFDVMATRDLSASEKPSDIVDAEDATEVVSAF